MKPQIPILVPSSIQRIRCFMNAEGGMEVKPWVGVAETLDAFTAFLAKRSSEDAFWKGLTPLVALITDDLKTRLNDDRAVVNNEVLSGERLEALLGEIRAAAAAVRTGSGGFRRCLTVLSGPAVGLLVLLGGAVSSGCWDSTGGNKYTSADAGNADTGSSADGDADMDADTDTDTDTDGTGRDTGASLEEIVTEHADPADVDLLLSCIESLSTSWQTGLEELFRNEDDQALANDLWCLQWNCAQGADLGDEYDYETMLDNCTIPVYIGVRFP